MPSDDTTTDRQALLNELEHVSFVQMVYFNRAVRQLFDTLGLTFNQALLLFFIERGHKTPPDLGKMLELGPTRISALISNSVRAGLIVRQEDETDRRRATLALTPKGGEVSQMARSAWRENLPLNLSMFNDEELDNLIAAVRPV